MELRTSYTLITSLIVFAIILALIIPSAQKESQEAKPKLTAQVELVEGSGTLGGDISCVGGADPSNCNVFSYDLDFGFNLRTKAGGVSQVVAILKFKDQERLLMTGNNPRIFSTGNRFTISNENFVSESPPNLDWKDSTSYSGNVWDGQTVHVGDYAIKVRTERLVRFISDCTAKVSIQCKDDQIYGIEMALEPKGSTIQETPNFQLCDGRIQIGLLREVDCDEKKVCGLYVFTDNGEKWERPTEDADIEFYDASTKDDITECRTLQEFAEKCTVSGRAGISCCRKRFAGVVSLSGDLLPKITSLRGCEFSSSPIVNDFLDDYELYRDKIISSANKYGISPALMAAVITQESKDIDVATNQFNWNPDAIIFEPHLGESSYGLMQILCSTARSLGFTGNCDQLFDSDINIDLGSKYLKQGLDYCSTRISNWDQLTDVEKVQHLYAYYNAGPGSNCNVFYKYRDPATGKDIAILPRIINVVNYYIGWKSVTGSTSLVS